MSNFKEKLAGVKALVFDIDGVLSQQTIPINSLGVPSRTINLRDGYAIQLAVKKGYRIGVISGGNSKEYIGRLNGLGVKDIYMNSRSKIDHMAEFIEKYRLDSSSVLYMGDDIPDFRVMKMVGIPVCPYDADSEIKNISIYISDKKGGEGCVRDIIEQVLRLHDKWLNEESYSW